MNIRRQFLRQAGAAYSEEECWQLVEVSEKAGRHLCMMKNVNFMPNELVISNLVQSEELGELTDCRAELTRVQSPCFWGFATCTP